MDFSKAQPGDDDLGDDSWGEEDDDWGEAEPTVAKNEVTGAAAFGRKGGLSPSSVAEAKPKLNPFGPGSGSKGGAAINFLDQEEDNT